jgi:hypothetical protein
MPRRRCEAGMHGCRGQVRGRRERIAAGAHERRVVQESEEALAQEMEELCAQIAAAAQRAADERAAARVQLAELQSLLHTARADAVQARHDAHSAHAAARAEVALTALPPVPDTPAVTPSSALNAPALDPAAGAPACDTLSACVDAPSEVRAAASAAPARPRVSAVSVIAGTLRVLLGTAPRGGGGAAAPSPAPAGAAPEQPLSERLAAVEARLREVSGENSLLHQSLAVCACALARACLRARVSVCSTWLLRRR